MRNRRTARLRADADLTRKKWRKLSPAASGFASSSARSRKSRRCRTSSRCRRRPTTSSCRSTNRKAGGATRPAGGVQVGVPDLRFLRRGDARIRQLRVRSAEIRRRRMPPARHDLRRAAQGDAAPDRVRCRSGNAGQVGQGHQGAGRLHGRHAAHDVERHLHRQRHRARDRLADAPLAGRVLRSRQGQDALVGQAPVRGAHHSLSRLVARLRVRRQGHRPCAHRPAAQAAGDDAALCARAGRRGDPQHLLSAASPTSAPRTAAGACRSIPSAWRASSRRTIWSTPRPARSWPRPARRSRRVRRASSPRRG